MLILIVRIMLNIEFRLAYEVFDKFRGQVDQVAQNISGFCIGADIVIKTTCTRFQNTSVTIIEASCSAFHRYDF